MNNPIHIARFFRADRLRKQQQGLIARTDAANDRKWDRDTAVFVACCILAYAAFCLALLELL